MKKLILLFCLILGAFTMNAQSQAKTAKLGVQKTEPKVEKTKAQIEAKGVVKKYKTPEKSIKKRIKILKPTATKPE